MQEAERSRPGYRGVPELKRRERVRISYADNCCCSHLSGVGGVQKEERTAKHTRHERWVKRPAVSRVAANIDRWMLRALLLLLLGTGSNRIVLL